MNLKDVRLSHGHTQQQVADALNLQVFTYNRYETGNRSIPLDVLIDLADYYAMSLDDLVGHTIANTEPKPEPFPTSPVAQQIILCYRAMTPSQQALLEKLCDVEGIAVSQSLVG